MKLISIVRVVIKKLVKGGVKYFNINKKVKINIREIVIPVRGGWELPICLSIIMKPG